MTEQMKPATSVRAHPSPTPLDIAARAAHRDSPGPAEPDTGAVPEEQPAGRAGGSSPADPAAVVSGAAAAAGGGLPGPAGSGTVPAGSGTAPAGHGAGGPGGHGAGGGPGGHGAGGGPGAADRPVTPRAARPETPVRSPVRSPG